MIIPEPAIIQAESPNKDFWYNDQIQQLFRALANLQLTSRDGAIQNGDKAGNFTATWVVFTSNGTANTEDAITHNLGHIPLGFFASVPDKAAVIYSSGTAWTSTTIYVKTSVASVAWKLMVF